MEEVALTLRRRIVRAIQAGALNPGDRLPSGRRIWQELGSSPRVVTAAYRSLARDGIVTMQPRSGVYLADGVAAGGSADALPEGFIVDVLALGLAAGVPIGDVSDRVRRLVETVRVRITVIASTSDQIAGLCRELEEDYGVQAIGIDAAALAANPNPGSLLRGADVLVTTIAGATMVQRLAEELRIPLIIAEVRLDLVRGEWRLLLREPVYVVVADTRFVDLLHRFFAGVPGASNLRPMLVGRDDLAAIPADAPTYITRSARERLGDTPVGGRTLPPIRLLSSATARQIIAFIVRVNSIALVALGQSSRDPARARR